MKRLLFIFSVLLCYNAKAQKEILYAGTFSVRGSEGLYVYNFDRQLQNLDLIQSIQTPESPSFIAIHPKGKFLYSANRGNSKGLPNTGSVTAFSIEQSNGKLHLMNEQASLGNGPCHISTDATGKLLFVSHYNEGALTVFNIEPDGSIGSLSDSIRFKGNGVHQRQEKSHAHAAVVSPDNKFLYVTDLGTDRVYCFSINLATGKLTPSEQPFITVKAGSGPRHFTFQPDGRYAYLVEELTSTVCVLSCNKQTGALTIFQDQVKTLPPNFLGTNTSADIHVDPTGKYLLMSNRGHESLAVFSINKKGRIALHGHVNTNGSKPRNFLIDPRNEFVMVAHQDSDDIAIFKWDSRSGQLSPTQNKINIPSPVCLQLLQLK
jgi:6-phosphogluconolactonase